jgi:hypothetical protein
MVIGRTPDTGERRVSIGVRRVPRLIASDKDSVSLLAAYLNIVRGHWDERLACSVSSAIPADKPGGRPLPGRWSRCQRRGSSTPGFAKAAVT